MYCEFLLSSSLFLFVQVSSFSKKELLPFPASWLRRRLLNAPQCKKLASFCFVLGFAHGIHKNGVGLAHMRSSSPPFPSLPTCLPVCLPTSLPASPSLRVIEFFLETCLDWLACLISPQGSSLAQSTAHKRKCIFLRCWTCPHLFFL